MDRCAFTDLLCAPPRNARVTPTLAAALLLTATLHAQAPSLAALLDSGELPAGLCEPQWEALFGAEPGVGHTNNAGGGVGWVRDAAVFDDGSGPALYIGGFFLTAGGEEVSNLARWDGSAWSDVAGGTDGEVWVLEPTTFAGGAQLWVGGEFSAAGGVAADNLACWDGSNFAPTVGGGPNGPVYALLEDISSDLLYVGGDFSQAGGDPLTQNFALYLDGVDFLDATGTDLDGVVRALAFHGGDIHLGGEFTASGATTLDHLARYDGTLSAVGGGVNGDVHALATYDDGGGPALVVGGEFTSAGSPALVAKSIAAWSGTSWDVLGGGVDGLVYDLQVWDDGGGEDLYLVGDFLTVGFAPGIENIARWNGTAFTSLGLGLTTTYGQAFTVFDDGGGESLWVVGHFYVAGGLGADGVARWDGAAWHVPNAGLNAAVESLCSTSFEDTPALYVGGKTNLRAPGAVGQRALARWKDGGWSGVGDLNGTVSAMAVFDDGGGPALFVGGSFTEIDGTPHARVAKWDGSTWSDVGGGVDGAVGALEVFDDGSGPALYAGGGFSLAGGASAMGIARWNGSAWSGLGLGLWNGAGAPPSVWDMLVWDDGGGDDLYVTGTFGTPSGAPGESIARWDGTAWSALGGGLAGSGFALATHDAGSGERLFVGGSFSAAGGAPASANLAVWTGSAWSGVASPPPNGAVTALAVYDDGDGPELHLGGTFSQIDLFPLPRLARSDGAIWSGMGSGLTVSPGIVRAMVVHDDCTSVGPRLIVGGTFTAVPDIDPDDDPGGGSYLGAWRGCWDDGSAWTDLGFALPGTYGNPALAGAGTFALDSVNSLLLILAKESSTAGLFLSFTSTPTPFAGGTLVPVPPLDPIIVTTSPAGTVLLNTTIEFCLPPGITLYAQWGIADPAAVAGVALSNAVVGVTP